MAVSTCQAPDPDHPPTACGAYPVADERCLAHLTPAARAAYLATLSTGSRIRAGGVTFTRELLADLLDALRDGQGRAEIGGADFNGATFTEGAGFAGATFTKDADFNGAAFAEDADFRGATFIEDADFYGTILNNANFYDATFDGMAMFARATFTGTAAFHEATFAKDANFYGTTFTESVRFDAVAVQGELYVEAAAGRVDAMGLRGEGRASFRLRAAEVDLTDVVFAGPVTVHGLPSPIEGADESALADAQDGRVPPVRVLSLQGLDAASVTLTDVDLSDCLFTGLQRADQLVLDGECVFADGPGRRQRVLGEEHHWRAARATGAGGWTPAPEGVEVVGPARLEVLYRQLRKALEDGKNEPGPPTSTSARWRCAGRRPIAARRVLLWLYWVVSGYGLRARRALGWLAVVAAISIIGMTVFGFPQTGKDQKATGTVTTSAGRQPIDLTIRQSDPVKPISARLEKATEVTLNAIIFRNPDADLTTAGRYLNIAVRVLGPILLGLSLLAIRNQVKR